MAQCVNLQESHQLVDDLSRFLTPPTDLKWLKSLVRHARFPTPGTSEEEVEQVRHRDKNIILLGLSPFNPSNEKEFEEWIEDAASRCLSIRACPALFKEAWANVAGSTRRPLILQSTGTRHEDIVDSVARSLFPRSTYVADLELELLVGKRCSDTPSAEHWMRTMSTRYALLCKRRGRQATMVDDRALHTCLRCLPRQVKAKFIETRAKPETPEELFELAAEYEESLREMGRFRSDETPVTPDLPVAAVGHSREGHVNRVPPVCQSCGAPEGTHWKKDCRHSRSRCRQCRLIGHIAQVCPNYVPKNQLGRPRIIVENKPGSKRILFKQDRSRGERLDTAKEAINQVQKSISKRTRTHRHKPLKAHGHQPLEDVEERQESHEAPVIVYDDSEADSDSYASVVAAAMCATSGPNAFEAKASLNDQQTKVIVDTGAAYSVMSHELAVVLGVAPDYQQPVKRFVGLGSAEGRLTQPVKVTLEGVERDVTFFAVEGFKLPPLLGMADLAKFDLHIDTRRRRLYVAPLTVVATSCNQDRLCPVKRKQPDTTSGVDESKSDETLLEEAKQYFDKNTPHLSPQRQTAIWNLWVKYSKCWLRPRAGKVNFIKAAFKVNGRPIKAKLRPLAPELKVELDKHLDSMLASGVIRPSKSAWGASPHFVKKQTGEWRMVLDYRPVNKVMESDAYPLPLIWENLQKAAHHRYYTTLDANWGFWNVPLEEESMQYTAIVTYRGTFEYTVIPFGIKNSPGEFQRAMNVLFESVTNKGVLVYVDDIVIFADTLEEHDRLLR